MVGHLIVEEDKAPIGHWLAGASNKERHEFVGVMEQMLKAAHGAEVAQQFKDKVCGSCVWGRAGQFCVGAGRGAACILSIK